jgi:hypothetical protein
VADRTAGVLCVDAMHWDADFHTTTTAVIRHEIDVTGFLQVRACR